MIGRRSFLAGILGAAVAPAIVKAEGLMKLSPLERTIRFRRWVPGQSGLTMLLDGEIGVIEQLRIVTSPPYKGVASPIAAARMELELRRAMQPNPFMKLIKRDLSLELLNPQHRKTA